MVLISFGMTLLTLFVWVIFYLLVVIFKVKFNHQLLKLAVIFYTLPSLYLVAISGVALFWSIWANKQLKLYNSCHENLYEDW